jgi:ubiquinone/menaquinone biosynthesis C-methylase UbiE
VTFETIRAYNGIAQTYEQRWAAYLRHTHRTFLQQLKLSKSDHILDLSSGTGLLASELIQAGLPFTRLVLNDPSSEMLNVARNRLPSRPDIEFSGSLAHELPFGDNSFTQVYSLNAFHHYPFQKQVIAEVFRVLKPGGQLLIQDWNRSGFFRPVNALIRWWVPDYIDTRSYEECRQMVLNEGFSILESRIWNYRYWKFFLMVAEK